MKIDGQPRLAPGTECPYLPDRTFVQRYFFGVDADLDETAALLGAGWRRFGSFFFRPDCPGCQACVPVRIDAAALAPTASQRRVWKKNQDVDFAVVPLEYRDEYYALYADHSRRFSKETDPEDFRQTFFEAAVPSFLTEYRIRGTLAGLGFCDEGADCLSSIYFVFGEEFGSRSLGTYSVLRECALAASRGRRWYNLGYWVQGNATMAYKGNFVPRQVMDWETGEWTPGPATGPDGPPPPGPPGPG
jgi:arginine-tRNA-protein transferase